MTVNLQGKSWAIGILTHLNSVVTENSMMCFCLYLHKIKFLCLHTVLYDLGIFFFCGRNCTSASRVRFMLIQIDF